MTTLDAMTIPTPAGPFTVLAEDGEVRAAGFTDDSARLVALVGPAKLREARLPEIEKAIDAYFDGDLAAIDTVPVRAPGTAFQEKAWAVLRAIPAGRPITYTELAKRVGSPNAIRAAGSACARNPVALFVPCHRVMRTDGTLGGYAYGLPVKEKLLALEGKQG